MSVSKLKCLHVYRISNYYVSKEVFDGVNKDIRLTRKINRKINRINCIAFSHCFQWWISHVPMQFPHLGIRSSNNEHTLHIPYRYMYKVCLSFMRRTHIFYEHFHVSVKLKQICTQQKCVFFFNVNRQCAESTLAQTKTATYYRHKTDTRKINGEKKQQQEHKQRRLYSERVTIVVKTPYLCSLMCAIRTIIYGYYSWLWATNGDTHWANKTRDTEREKNKRNKIKFKINYHIHSNKKRNFLCVVQWESSLFLSLSLSPLVCAAFRTVVLYGIDVNK